ncbi:very short patch repair endonuclease [Pseudomonas sp. SCB32]|uniref:very short patch repair endonuclease n=1 Tax=Pseudomonas sp. SCB32 TaxID=2653853 RepID=UPI0012647770|nr:very short patch repair endonuclease [Pseudomonas sp. SCB32]
MADVLTPEQRKCCMSRVRSRDTGPEMLLRRRLWAAGLRYRLKVKLPGKPDIVFVARRLAVFVDGCFWHRCPLHSTTPKGNSEFWCLKLNENVKRDRRVDDQLEGMGWIVVRFWEHEVNGDVEACVREIVKTLAREVGGK